MRNPRRNVRVGRICTRVFPSRGGPAKHAYNLSEALESLGVHCSVVACSSSQKKKISYHAKLDLLPIAAPSPNAGLVLSIGFSLSFLVLGSIWSLWRFLKDRVDVVHAHSPSIAGFVGMIVAKIIRKPLVFTIHGMIKPGVYSSEDTSSLFEHALESITLRNAETVVTITSDYIPDIRAVASSSKVVTIGNGVDTGRFRPLADDEVRCIMRSKLGIPEGHLAILWVGNFDIDRKVRGVKDTLWSLHSIGHSPPVPWVFLLVGNGRSIVEVAGLASELGLSERVFFLEHRDDISNIMQASDLFVLASHHEGSPNALLEAISTGMPCITTQVGGIPAIASDIALMVEPGDIEGLSAAISQILQSPRLRREMSKKSRQHAIFHLSWRHVAKKTAGVYATLLSDHDFDNKLDS